MKVLIIGAGIFGTSAAIELAKERSFQIDLIERESDIMQKASLCNHNRLHLGYHYLRSYSTAEQSLEGLLSFMFNYGEAAIYQFPNYYAIAKEGSRTNTAEFKDFCTKVGIGFDEEYPSEQLLNPDKVESCFRVPEPVFDYSTLKEIVERRIHASSNINLFFNTECRKVSKSNGLFNADLNGKICEYDVVVNVTYNNINLINKSLGVCQDQLRFEHVFIPFFLYPSEKIGLTIMDGEFCSVMPKGNNKNEFLLYHVKHSVLNAKHDYENNIEKKTIAEEQIDTIYNASAEFYPFLQESKHFGYWETVRTVHENKDDARVTELFSYDEIDNYFTILSGKIPTCMQVALHLKHIIQGKTTQKRFKI